MSNLTEIPNNLTALQLHVAFWDTNNDSYVNHHILHLTKKPVYRLTYSPSRIITPLEIYTGFRALGFSILFSLGGLLINFFFSYPTTLGHSWIPDPLFRIYTASIHKAKHGSDTGAYDSGGHIRWPLFDEMFARMDASGASRKGDDGDDFGAGRAKEGSSLGVGDLWRLHARNRVAADPAGWSFAAMEWWTTWLLLQRDGRIWKEDLRDMYDGSLFWRIRDKRMTKGDEGCTQGYGWREWINSLWNNGTWKTWEVDSTEEISNGREL
ncbi:MAG: hypothetical protein Q9219_005547 [cf. Caloplaca sp. 3 TL-2023]